MVAAVPVIRWHLGIEFTSVADHGEIMAMQKGDILGHEVRVSSLTADEGELLSRNLGLV